VETGRRSPPTQQIPDVEPWVSPTAALAFGLTGRLVGLRAELGPRHQMRVREESGHVDADLGDQFGGCYRVDAGNLSKPGRRAGERADLLFDAGIERG